MRFTTRQFLFITMLGVTLLGGSALISWMFYQNTQQQLEDYFQTIAADHFTALETQLDKNLHALISLNAHFLSSEKVDRHGFHIFTQPFLNRIQSIQALEWIPHITHSQRPAYEVSVQNEGFSDYSISEKSSEGAMISAHPRSAYYPVHFVEPLKGNEKAVGFDLASNPIRKLALDQARDEGGLVATDRITLVQETSQQAGFLVFSPVYEGADSPTSKKERQVRLRGFALGVYRVGDLVTSAMGQFQMPLIQARIENRLDGEWEVIYGERLSPPTEGSALLFERNLIFGTKTWKVQYWPTQTFFKENVSYQWMWVFGSVGMASLLLLLLLGSTLFRRASIEQEVHKKTQQISRVNAQLVQSNKELDDFAYIASHDLKEPLRGIHNYSKILLEDHAEALDEDARTRCETLLRLSRHMETLIDTLLYFSRVGRSEMAMKPTELESVLGNILESLDISLKECGVLVRVPQTFPTVLCDSIRVGEIFRNLITNAMKYNDKPEKWIEIGYLDDQPEASVPPSPLVFFVRDNGIGIREKHLSSIFRIFKRLHGRDKFGGGTGAGLTMTKKMIERHGGRIWVESIYGEGTTFYLTLEPSQGVEDTIGQSMANSEAVIS